MPVLDMEAMKRKLEETAGFGYSIYKPTYGPNKNAPHINRIKLFSWPPQGGELSKEVIKHYALGPQGKAQAICRRMIGGNCPVCDFIDAAGTDPTKVKMAERLRAATRQLMLVADWDLYEKEGKVEIKVYDAPAKIHREIAQTMASQDYDFTDFESALIVLKGYAQGPNVPKAIEFEIAMKKMVPEMVKLNPEEWIATCPDLDKIIEVYSEERLHRLLHGGEEEQGASDEIPSDNPVEEPAAEEPKAEATPVAQKPTAQPVATTPTAQPTATAATAPKKNLADLLKKK
jgi:hypothetical protein